MTKWIVRIGIVGFFICLILMYGSEHGIRGIRKYDSSFQLLDMRFHYSSKEVARVFEAIGDKGRNAYKRYLILDFFFILCLLITMFAITNHMILLPSATIILYVICILRAIFDCMENSALLIMLSKYPTVNHSLNRLCACFTTSKFIMLFSWLIGIVLMRLLRK